MNDEFNIFSYVQLMARFFNVEKQKKTLEELRKTLEELRKNLKKLRRSRKLNKEKRANLLKYLSQLRIENYFFVGSELSDFINELNSFLKNPRYFSLDEIRNLEYKAESLKDPRYALEVSVKVIKHHIEQMTQRCKRLLDEYERGYRCAGYRVARFEATLLERALPGVSQTFGKLLFEIGLEFDPYLNVPIIPGSSIKGALRVAYEYASEPNWPSVSDIFGEGGEHARVGSLIFTDAYPVEPGRGKMILYPDILTPHYSRKGEDILEEWGWEPTPIPYLSVAPGTTFGFIIASRRDELSETNFMRVVKAAFNLGLGAKTSVGYGRLELKVNRITFRR